MVPFLISFVFSIFYISMQTFSIYAGDSGELVTAAYTWSIAHPPGYPLYTLLGNIISHSIPLFTVAWRVGLLSSIPMAASIFFIWNIVFHVTKSKTGATVGSMCYGFLYPVWLYAIVPEVFGLFSFFSALLLYVFFRFIETKNQRFVFLLAFLSGLSLTHHHLIFFLLFSMIMSLFYSYKKVLISQIKNIWKILAFFFLGFCVYIYAPIASSQYPPLDWEHPARPLGFFRLITRASYGTFKASFGTGESLVDRGLNIFTLGQYILKDFTFIGIMFFSIGAYAIWKKKRLYALFFLIYLLWQFFYFFYAGFSLTSDFALGTLERFFIIPYQILTIGIGIGVWGFLEILRNFWQRHRSDIHIPFFLVWTIVVLLFLVIPLQSIKRYYTPLKALRQDVTLEKLVDDIFASTPQGSILNLTDDTSIFAVFYGYYVQKKRQDIRLILFPQFQFPYYPLWLKHHYDDINIPSTPQALSYPEYLKIFLKANYSYRPILNERKDAAVPEYWVPRGLLVMYYQTLEEIPLREQILAKNNSLWNSFQDPLSGVIGVYKHMMLSDVLRYYSSKRITLAQAYLISGNVTEAQSQIGEAVRLTPNRLELFVSYIEDLIKGKKCSEAKDTLEHITNVYVNQQFYLELFHRLYVTCPDLQQSLQMYENEFQSYSTKNAEKIE